jgi:hypothetical protein
MEGDKLPNVHTNIQTVEKRAVWQVACLIFIIALSTFTLAVPGLSMKYAKAQTTPYQVDGQIQKTDVIYHVIYGVNVGDLVLVSVCPTSGDPHYWSAVYYPNMTVLQSTGKEDYYPDSWYSVGGAHSYEFVATQAGNYLLKFWTNTDYVFNYTIRSSAMLTGVLNPSQSPTDTPEPTPTPTLSPTPTVTLPPTPTPTATLSTTETGPTTSTPPTQTNSQLAPSTNVTPPSVSTIPTQPTITPTNNPYTSPSTPSTYSPNDTSNLLIILLIVSLAVITPTAGFLVARQRKSKQNTSTIQHYPNMPKTQSTIKCKYCGAENPSTFGFCGQCSHPLKDDETKIY